MIIYKTTNLINGKIYIGQDKYNNSNYFGSGKKLKLAIKKYGKENFRKDILCYCSSCEEMNQLEIWWISVFNSTDRNIGYNISKGGHFPLGVKVTEEARKNMSLAGKGRIVSEETRRKISEALIGKKHSEERKRQNSECHKGIKLSEETKKKLSLSHKGKKYKQMSEQGKKNIAKSQKGRIPWNKGIKCSEERKRKQSEKMKGRKLSNEHKEKIKLGLKLSNRYNKIKGD